MAPTTAQLRELANVLGGRNSFEALVMELTGKSWEELSRPAPPSPAPARREPGTYRATRKPGRWRTLRNGRKAWTPTPETVTKP